MSLRGVYDEAIQFLKLISGLPRSVAARNDGRKTSPLPITITNHKAAGFTLVELAIVIVIIGLLVGGVMQGQELIKQAKQRKIAANLESYKAAIITFKGKYNDLPGDSARHATFFSGVGIVEGDGNGTYNLDSEIFELWRALSSAKLIKGNYSGYSGQTYTTSSSVPTENDASIFYRCMGTSYLPSATIYSRNICGFWLANSLVYSVTAGGNALFTPNDAKLFDMKFDDGVPFSGKMLAARRGGSAAGVCTDNDAYVSTTTTSAYVNNDNMECVMVLPETF